MPIDFNLVLNSKLSFSIIFCPIPGGEDGFPEKIEIRVKQKIKIKCLRFVNDLFFFTTTLLLPTRFVVIFRSQLIKYNRRFIILLIYFNYTFREVDRVGFEPTISAMPMPYPTRLDDRPYH